MEVNGVVANVHGDQVVRRSPEQKVRCSIAVPAIVKLLGFRGK